MTTLASEEKANAFKLMRLILDLGGEALRITLKKQLSGIDLFLVLYNPTNMAKLSKLKNKQIGQEQWDLLYPSPPTLPNENDFDITLLCILLRNICNLKPPHDSIWKNIPNPTDHSTEADITRIRLFRNDRFAHLANASVSFDDFQCFWVEISEPLVRLGITQGEIDQLKNVEDVLSKKLVSLDFEREITHHYEQFLEGTREWVFDEFLAWFHSDRSENRAFVISAVAGMGKSVIAATLCKRYPQYLSAVHFFQHNNSRYNKANTLLQSLAFQIAHTFPAYQQLLEKKLSVELSQRLNSMKIEKLFTLLFTDLFSEILTLPKRILIVLDALDECGYPERDDLTNLIVNHLHKLPQCFRFVITTRPNEVSLNTFEKLNPLFIKCSDDRNLNDIKLLVDERIGSSNSLLDLKNDLVDKADGHMLLASLLCNEVKNQGLSNASIPKNLDEYYETYLKRLGKELELFKITEKKFLSALDALAVAKEPLPWQIIEDILCLNSTCISIKVRKIISCLFVTNKEGCVSFFHKSITDWLLVDCEHDYSVKTSLGHLLVLEFCSKTLDDVIALKVNYDIIQHASLRYSVNYWLPHMLSACDNDCIVENVCKYLVDLEVLIASIFVDFSQTCENFKLFIAHETYFHLSEDTRLLFNDLYSLLSWNEWFDNEIIFLQNVVNQVKDLSSQATTMLQTRFKDSPYLESRDACFGKALLLRLFHSLISIDVSRNHDYVICGYEGFIVQLFSLKTNRCLWIKNLARELEKIECKEFCIVFHPFKDSIFASQLYKVLDINGKISSSPLHCDDSTSKFFTNKCFSKDKCTMVTSYKDTLTVWDVKKGERKRSIRCSNVASLCFSNSEKYLGVIAVVDEEKKRSVFRIFDVENNYKTFICDDHLPLDKIGIMFTVGLHSWCCSAFSSRSHIEKLFIVNPTDEKLPDLSLVPEVCWYPLDPLDDNISSFCLKGPGMYYFILSDDFVLLFAYGCDFYLCSIASVLLTNTYNFHNENFCSNENFLYQRDEENSMLVSYNLNTCDFFVRESLFRDMVAVGMGVILLSAENIPELWNNDLTKLLCSFDELKGTNSFFEVSDLSIACQKTDSLVFFNIENKRTEISIKFENYQNVQVLACSSKYHVFAKVEFDDETVYYMWHEDNLVNSWDDMIQREITRTIQDKELDDWDDIIQEEMTSSMEDAALDGLDDLSQNEIMLNIEEEYSPFSLADVLVNCAKLILSQE
ncbi:uncharacterized protein LOC124455502 isoform X2 [Xenia sp. Carnegie-2017]|uniref:uncharacterized protein LOC124455502 isoform X2 n=1 Tax=Xenia sp. Carnegie-2017 TaxID=2897299 RepID=UPI001F03E25F|nr:uncharacterized protein LOC124455502 isoform X2 [Xenia sp. Carnegie-2017]